jgi:hypothetical protein
VVPRYGWPDVEKSTDEEASEVVKELGGEEQGSSFVMKILHRGKLLSGPATIH